MKFSVIVPTCNRNVLLEVCLDALLPANQTLADDFEIIVTDDSCDHLARELIDREFKHVKWVAGPQKGPAANRNNGATAAGAEWLIFIDDDVIPDANLLNNYKLAIENNPDCLAFEGAIFPDDWNLMKKEMAECPVNTAGNCFWSANICINRKVFGEIGGFDESFLLPALEDNDIYERMKPLTIIPFLPNCIVIHPVRFSSLSKKMKGLRRQFLNWIYYTRKHSTTNISVHLKKSVTDYLRMSARDLINLRMRLFTLHMISSFYCFYLFLKYKGELVGG